MWNRPKNREGTEQRRELTESTNYTAPKNRSNEISIRRATVKDYDDIINMMEVYEGYDYLPTFYHIFMQSKQHVVYVAETVKDRRFVGLANYRIAEDGKTAYPMSGRMLPNFEGTGIVTAFIQKFVQEFQGITRLVLATSITRESTRRLFTNRDVLGLHYQWNFLTYKIMNESLRTWSTTNLCRGHLGQHLPHKEPISLKPTAISDQLLTDIQQFMQQFASEFAPSAYATWCPCPLDRPHTPALLKYQLMTANTLVTYFAQQHLDADESVCMNPISALSLLYPFMAKTGRHDGHVIAHLFAYCNDDNELANHVRTQLRHLANVAGLGHVYIMVHFPMVIDVDAMEKYFADNTTAWPTDMSAGAFLKRSAYMASVHLPSKL